MVMREDSEWVCLLFVLTKMMMMIHAGSFTLSFLSLPNWHFGTPAPTHQILSQTMKRISSPYLLLTLSYFSSFVRHNSILSIT